MISNYWKQLTNKYFKSFAYFYQRLGYRVFVRIGLNIVVGILDGFGLAMFLPLLEIANNAQNVKPDGLGNLGFLVEGMNNLGMSFSLFNVLLIISLFFIFKGMALYISSLYEVGLRQYFVKNTRTRLTHLMSDMSYTSFVLSDAGKIQNALSAEVSRLSSAFQQYFGAAQQVVMVVVYMVFAFFVDPKFALLICIGGGLTNFVYKKIYTSTEEASRKLTRGSNFYQGYIIQYVNNFKYLKATGLLKTYSKKLLGIIDYIEDSNKKMGSLGAIITGTREPLLIIVVSTVILMQVNVLGGSLGTILISLLFFYRALTALMLMQASYNGFLAVSGSMENMRDFEQGLLDNQEQDGHIQVKQFKRHVSLSNATFGYTNVPVLKDINISIEKYETVAFVGESGSGKTTLVNILAGLIPLDQGKMVVDGVDRSRLNINSYQRRIGYITQDPVIFNDTIFNNVTFWDTCSPDSLLRFEQAIKKASLAEFVDGLPDKEQSRLGNNGINLSGGQRQRVSIARELYKDIDILILDEATSALDSETEKAIQEGMEELHGKYTLLVVAHRLSTIKNADRIIVLNKGQIVDEGAFHELILKSSKFQRMVELQEV